jgi:predicted ATPase/DNA-binding CsgD family transcriptional regulator/DNA-binding XRE family transcriptional regulator
VDADDGEFGARLRELRERLRLSQEQLAQRLGVSFATVNRWEGGRSVPSPRSRARLEQLLRQAADADGAPGPGPAGPRLGRQAELPTELRPFIGRARELDELLALWAGCRTLTLTGAGGIGKSRLAAELLRRAGDPVLGMVRLDTVRDPALVPAAVAMALGVRGKPNVPERIGIVEALRPATGVLLLDTCEHVVDHLHDLLRHILENTAGVRVLATSQIPLGLSGEYVWRVPGLALPPTPPATDPVGLARQTGPERGPGPAAGPPARTGPVGIADAGAASPVGAATAEGEPDAADHAGYDAVRFFVSRARERAPGFTLDGPATADVVEICRRLDGIPLSIGLAAAWMGTLTPAELLQRWDTRTELLSDPTAEHERHRTPASTIEWSSALLTATDRRLVAQLSVFVGAFTIEDIEAVAAGPGGAALLAAVRRLGEVSWLEFAPGTAAGTYTMLDPLRLWGLSVLDPVAAEATRTRHARHFAALCERARLERFRSEAGWPQRLAPAVSNLNAALTWYASSDPEAGTAMALSLLGWWRQSGRLVEGRHWLRVFSQAEGMSEVARARAGCAEALTAVDIGDYDEAEVLAERARQVLERHQDLMWTGRAQWALSAAAKYRGDPVQARDLLEQALANQRRHGDQFEVASTLNNLGSLSADMHDLDAAERYCRASMELKRTLGDDRSLALTMANLADVYTQRHRHAEARELLADAMTLAEAVNDDFLITLVRINLGDSLLRVGDFAAAVTPLRQALEQSAQAGVARFHALAACGLGQAMCGLGETARGLRLLRQSRSIARRINDEIVLAQVQVALAEVTTRTGPGPAPELLSSREAQVLELVAAGMTNREIAGDLEISPATVQRHLANIYTKLDVRNRTEAARRGIDLGLWPRARYVASGLSGQPSRKGPRPVPESGSAAG